MAKELDIGWLLSRAGDEETKKLLLKIDEWRKQVLRENKFIDHRDSFPLLLDGYRLWFDVSSSYAAIEVYLEIFRDNNHCSFPGFDGIGARVVVDIGANQGFYSLHVRRRNPNCRIIAVEPNPYVFPILKKNVSTNGIADMVLENLAVSPVSGKITLSVVPQISSIGGCDLKTAERPWLKTEFIENLEVKATSLDELFERHGIEMADIVKIDIEGLEYDVLKESSVLDKIDRMVVEYHSSGTLENLSLLMEKRGFELQFHDHDGRSSYGDVYFKHRRT